MQLNITYYQMWGGKRARYYLGTSYNTGIVEAA